MGASVTIGALSTGEEVDPVGHNEAENDNLNNIVFSYIFFQKEKANKNGAYIFYEQT